MDISFVDKARQDEIDNFYEACQKQRDYYRGYPGANHPLAYFRNPETAGQCPPEMSVTYLSYPPYHVKYKQPAVLAQCVTLTSGIPSLPERTLAPRYNKAACKAFIR